MKQVSRILTYSPRLRAFGAVHASSDVTAPPSTLSDVLAQPLFHNRRLAGPGGAPLVDKWSGCLDGPWQPWAAGGIERIADLVEREGPGYAFKTLATLQCEPHHSPVATGARTTLKTGGRSRRSLCEWRMSAACAPARCPAGHNAARVSNRLVGWRTARRRVCGAFAQWTAPRVTSLVTAVTGGTSGYLDMVAARCR